MIILYDGITGEIFDVIKEVDWLYYDYNTVADLEIKDINETEPNRAERVAIIKSVGKVNDQGEARFYINTQTNQVEERVGWVESGVVG